MHHDNREKHPTILRTGLLAGGSMMNDGASAEVV
jgi:hypothetical protein